MEPVILNRYLANQLSDTERAEFERRMVESPAVIEELEAVARLKVGLFTLHGSGDLAQIVASQRRWPQTSWFALAASVAAVAIGVLVWRTEPRVSAPVLTASLAALVDDSGGPLAVVGRHAVLSTRADGYDAVIEAPRSAGAIELRVLPDASAAAPGEHARYRVELARIVDDSKVERLAVVDELRAREDGFVTLFASSAQLVPGKYRLSIVNEGGGPSAPEDVFSVRVR